MRNYLLGRNSCRGSRLGQLFKCERGRCRLHKLKLWVVLIFIDKFFFDVAVTVPLVLSGSLCDFRLRFGLNWVADFEHVFFFFENAFAVFDRIEEHDDSFVDRVRRRELFGALNVLVVDLRDYVGILLFHF